MPIILAIALGGALGAVARHVLSISITRIVSWLFSAAYSLFSDRPLAFSQSSYYPLVGTFFVNLLGAFLMGIAVGYLVKTLPYSEVLRAFIMIGFLGGFTTFSAFSLQMLGLYDRGEFVVMGLYGLASVTLCMLATMLGLWLVRGG